LTYLLDVNALLALAHMSHAMHDRAQAWVARLSRADRLATCAITELGFVRVGPQARLSPDVAASAGLLAALKQCRHPPFVVLSDALGAADLPVWVKTPGQTTDGHLLALAGAHGARLATFDAGIPGAVPIE